MIFPHANFYLFATAFRFKVSRNKIKQNFWFSNKIQISSTSNYYLLRSIHTYSKLNNQFKINLSDNLVFENEIKANLNRSNRSFIFKIAKTDSIYNLLNYFNQNRLLVGDVYLFGDENQKYSLIEFKTDINKNEFIKSESVFRNLCAGRILLFRNYDNKESTGKINDVNIFYGSMSHDINNLINQTGKFNQGNFKNSNEQADFIYDQFKIDTLNERLRYFIASMIADPLKNVNPNTICVPFGSSINKFGLKKSDLDLLLLFNKDFLDGDYESLKNSKNQRDISIKVLGKLKEKFESKSDWPFFDNLRLLDSARVPILEIDFNLDDKISCDLSMNKFLVSLQTTKLYWYYNKMDDRVEKLVFLVRLWSIICLLPATQKPSRSLRNFHFTFLCLNYLLRIKEPIIVSLENVTEDVIYTNRDEPRHLIKNLSIDELRNLIQFKNGSDLVELFIGFLEYYSQFDFHAYPISLRENLINKRIMTNKNLVIEDPFDHKFKYLINVSNQELERFVLSCKISLDLINRMISKNRLDFILFFSELKSSMVLRCNH